MKQIEIKLPGGTRVLAWEDGEIIIEGPINKIESLLYITQEYQKEFGGFKLKTDFSEWRGISGSG